MILSHDDLAAIENKPGPENAAPIINALEKLEHEQKVEVTRDLLLELATKADIANLRTEMAGFRSELKGDIIELRGEIKRLETLIKVLIGLVVVAMGLFSPTGVELIKLLK